MCWFAFIGMVLLICYLSFQPQSQAKVVDKDITMKIAERFYDMSSMTEEETAHIIWVIRTQCRVFLFCALGLIGTATIHLTFRKINWFFRAVISVFILVAIAVFTEKFKEYLPTRHFSQEEMIYSIAGVMIGFVLVSAVTLVYSLVKWIAGKIINSLRR